MSGRILNQTILSVTCAFKILHSCYPTYEVSNSLGLSANATATSPTQYLFQNKVD